MLNEYGINNPELNKVAAYYAEKFNDQATLNWLKRQHPYIRSQNDDPNFIESIAMMLMGGVLEESEGSMSEDAGSVPAKSAFDRVSDAEASGADTGSRSTSSISPKIIGQMGSRGWNIALIDDTIADPAKTSPAENKATGSAATAYFATDGSYVVRDNLTKQIIQISNRNDPYWAPDSSIVNPPSKR